MNKTANWLQISVFLVFIALFFVINIITPSKDFSEQENRPLQQLPKFSFESLFSTKYTKDFETYTIDQFPFRDNFTTMKAKTEFLIGKEENKGIFLCEGDNLIENYEKPNETQINANMNAVVAMKDNLSVPTYFALIPTAAEVHKEFLPENAPNYSQELVINSCYEKFGNNTVDMLGALSAHKDEYIYYKTDHHWTSLGAYLGYCELLKSMGMNPLPESYFSPTIVNQEFYGTVYSKSGISWASPDFISVFTKQNEATTVMNYSKPEGEIGTMYDDTYLEKKDKYSMFMGGVSPLQVVETGLADAPSILIIRDSYTDSIIPFLQNHFSQIHVMDLRYYKTRLMESSISEYVAENAIDNVLVMYSLDTFDSDTNIFLLAN